jgi:excisionase family DNA binding protein
MDEPTERAGKRHVGAEFREAPARKPGPGGSLHLSWWAQDGELTVSQIAQRLGVSDGTIYDWIRNDKLHGRRGPGNRLYIPFGPDVEQDCRQRVANSVHLPTETKIGAAGGAV